MTRRTRTAALLSTATLLTGAAFALAFAPSAAADIPTPPLGTLVADPAAPTAGDVLHVSGTGCFTLPTPVTTASAAAPAADPAAGSAAPAAPSAAPAAGSVTVTVTGPDSFSSGDTATASDDGSWAGDNGVTLGDAGTYTVDATCTLTDPLLGQQATFDYDSLTVDVAAPPVVVDPSVTCSGCQGANPGDTVTIGGTDFPAGSVATIALPGYDSKTAPVDASGGFNPVSFVIAANQPAGTLNGTVTDGSASAPFTVTVVLPTDGGGSVDGPVPGSGDTGGASGTGTDTGSSDVPVTTSGTSGVDTSSAAPQLPSTGTNSLWPGVIGGLLVLSGTGLLWVSRRRDDTDVTAV